MKEEIIVDEDRTAFYMLMIIYQMAVNDKQCKMVEEKVRELLDKDQQEEWFRLAKNPLTY